MLSTEVLATFDGSEALVLGPYDQAMVPALWGTGWTSGTPPELFLAYHLPTAVFGLSGNTSRRPKIIPGVCKGSDVSFMLCIYNDTVDSVTVEPGDVLAVARRMPADLATVTAARDAAECTAHPIVDGSRPAEDGRPESVCAVHDHSRPSGVIDKDILSPCEPSEEGEHVFHLVQDEPLITRIHNEELPPDSYYEELGKHLIKKFRGADPDLIEHAVALAAAFDTASAFALSFGIKKFQFAQKEVLSLIHI